MPKYSSWFNKDGLVVNYGTRTTQKDSAGSVKTFGPEQTIVFPITLASLSTAATVNTGIYAPQYAANAAFLPPNSLVTEVKVVTKVAATSGGAATLSIGTYTLSASTGLFVVDDIDALFEPGDAALADFSAVGESITLIKGGANGIGAAVGSTSANLYIAAIYATAAFTAGEVVAYIKYVKAA